MRGIQNRGDSPSFALVVRDGDRLLQQPMVVLGQLQWPELEGQLVDLAIEAERHLIVLGPSDSLKTPNRKFLRLKNDS